MLISLWTPAILSLFALQFSYKSNDLAKHIRIVNGSLVSCIYPDDSPFKKGSPTFPRSELRLKDPLPDGNYRFTVNYTDIQTDDSMEYSVWQAFGADPLLMLRKRKGQLQMVVFDGKPKIQEVSALPTSCDIYCGKKVVCGSYISTGKIKCAKKLHMKIGAYSQTKRPTSDTCITYGGVSIDKIK